VTANLRVKEVKEVKVSEHERFLVCHNPEAADRDAVVRANLVARLEAMIAGSDGLSADKRAAARGDLYPSRAASVPARHPERPTSCGPPCGRGRRRGRREAGRQVPLCTADPHLSAEDIALGYKQLLEVERGWRDMKQVLDLRPVFHRLEDRIRAHVLLCWLALLLARIVETRAATTTAPAPATSSNACTRAPSPARPGCSDRPATPATRLDGYTPP
jgi:IS4 transposase